MQANNFDEYGNILFLKFRHKRVKTKTLSDITLNMSLFDFMLWKIV